jgi:hypothetical protein
MATFHLEPELPRGDIVAGDPARRALDRLLLGKLVESGPAKRLYLDISGEQVVAVLGKRGTGKSYSLGVMLEGLAAGAGSTQIADLVTPRAGLVLDIMDIFWTSAVGLVDSGSQEIRKQFGRMSKGGYVTQPLNIDIWIPAGFARPEIDPLALSELFIQASDLGLDDWSDLFSVDIYGEPRGMLIAEIVAKTGQEGYVDQAGSAIAPQLQFNFLDLLKCLETAADIQVNYREDTRRSVRQRLSTFASMALFAGKGTRLTEILRPYRVSVLMLARLPDELKKVVVSVLLKRILRERRDSSFAQKRLDLDTRISEADRGALSHFVDASIPRTWVLLDEAHVLAGTGERSVASEALVKYAKEGRNYGLSMAVATQQPSALDPRLTSQAETMIVHQLTSPADAAIATQNVRSPLPSTMKVSGEEQEVDSLFRRLGQGEMVFSCGNAPSLPRICVAMVRPRISAHGGYEA